MSASPKPIPTGRPSRVIFVTGTDTGVGKTLLSALLVKHLHQAGRPVLALKPFCSGSRADAELLHALQDPDISIDAVNPWFFPEPLAPQAAARIHRQRLQPEPLMRLVRQTMKRCRALVQESSAAPTLIIEGAGGLLVPIARDFTMLDWITRLAGEIGPARSALASRLEVLIVAGNKLGVINHTLLTVRALAQAGLGKMAHTRMQVILMSIGSKDEAARSNPALLREWLGPVPMHEMPYLGPKCGSLKAIERAEKQLRGLLQQLIGKE